MSEHANDQRTVIVGVDRSPGSAVALSWAIEHAEHLGRLIPVLTFVGGPFEHELGTHTRSDATAAYLRDEAVTLLSGFLSEEAPALVDDGVVIEAPAGPGLVDVSEGSELLVLGARGWSARAGTSIGSVGAYCARHAKVPVALVPHVMPPADERLSVVVGMDGSAPAAHAVRWTLDHVQRTAVVTLVRVTTEEAIVGDPLSASDDEIAAHALRELEDSVAGIVAGAEGHPEVRLLVVHGDPRDALGAAVPGADLLVVGARGHGVIHRLLLGSVAMALADHPTLPTIIVPQHAD